MYRFLAWTGAIGALAVSLSSCATPEWPAREVSVHRLTPIQPWQVQFPQRNMDKAPCGEIVSRLLIDENGHVKRVQLIQGSGDGRLDRAAVEGAMRAAFEPYRENGQPIPVSTMVMQRIGRNPANCAR